ncbi:D-2-hydroxyacid dehydrogenase [Paenibacillus sp. N3/727]|uniref:D-2-hydroxyacid dehydrogenase n=1 Tax=Paenibacillus sp. N3/727 TaxID=2925845 RepID=UPI001F52EF4F|nr:D-2-hydroxyacid dehydrogenase [Paenibacillus sp. N3/727]UNK17632.1 D-2-hydroxyacid dehydrogenase [Paenibacillus sp. N3/727]
MPNIVALHELTTEQMQKIRDIAPDYELIAGKYKELPSGTVAQADIVLGWTSSATEEVLSDHSRIRWIQVWSAGVDRMPLKELEQKNIFLTNASGVHSIPITEQIFSMLLAYTRNLHHAVRQQSQSKWDKSGTFRELSGKTAVIVGVGQIGSTTAKVAKAFGMRTVGVRRSGKPDPNVDVMYTVDQLDQALAEGDFIINILPLTDETKGLYDAGRFEAMKDGAFFVNMGRGPSVNTEALIEALKSGHLAGAGLDVFEQEPLPSEHPLWGMDNVIITPHTAGDTVHYTDRVLDIFIENLKAYRQGEALPRNVIDYGKAY